MAMSSHTGVKTVEHHYWLHGGGGKGDLLTEVWQKVTYEWDSNANVVQALFGDGGCTWAAYNGWENDECAIDRFEYGGDHLWRQNHGDFHWDPWYASPQYYHTLWSNIYAVDSGDHSCWGDYAGSYPSGPGTGFAQTCEVS